MTEEEKDKQQAEAKAEVEAKAETKTETEAEESTETKPKSKPKAKAPAKAKASAQGKEEAGEGGGGDGDGRFADLLERIDAMTVRELVDFVAAIEERYNVSAAAAVAPAPVAAPAAAAGDGAAEAAPSTLQVVLKSAGQQKVQVIKKVKEITGKGLKESKELVDGAPSVIKDGVDPDEANRLKAQLEEVGAEVELK